MQPDDESQTTLSKWPFILGDVLLVGTALAIAILGGWQLTDWQVGACVAAVALGAALFTLPYVVEYQVRVREEREDRSADLRVLERHIVNAEQTLSAIDARLDTLESEDADAEKPNAELTALIDAKINQLEAVHSSQEEAIQKLQKDVEKLPKAAPAAFDPEMLKPFEKRLEALEARPLPEAKPEAKALEAAPVDQDPAPAADEEAPEEPLKTVPQIERPKRSTRERHRPEESRLLRRAITDKGDNASAAVSRIIESKKKKEATPEPPIEKKADDLTEQKKPKGKVKVDAEPAAVPEKPDSNEKLPPQAREDTASTPDKGSEPADEAAPTAEASDMLFDEENISSPVTRTKAKKNDAVVTASVFIGIGNKPYLRGSGGGLNWEQGEVMEFQEIGKWRWVAPADCDSTLELQIFRNDEEPDQSGKYKLEPGQKLEIKPVF